MPVPFATEPGSPHPLGITTRANGVNISIFSEAATEVVLLLFDSAAAIEPAQIVRFDPFQNKTFHGTSSFAAAVRDLLRASCRRPERPGVWTPVQPNKVLISPSTRDFEAAVEPVRRDRSHDNLATSMRCAVVDTSACDWEGDGRSIGRSTSRSSAEVHAGGFTRSPTVASSTRARLPD
jgi:glycogen operon protein